MEKVVYHIKCGDLLNDEQDERAAYVISEKILRNNIRQLTQAFPVGTQHYYALKANPLTCVMKIIREEGLGIEAASVEEIQSALKNGFPPNLIIFNSPCKSHADLKFALQHGIQLNVEHLTELKKLKKIREEFFPNSQSIVGLRINPQFKVDEKLINAATATAVPSCKFGIPIKEDGIEDEVLKEISNCDWISSIHCHAGSGGTQLKPIVDAVRFIAELAEKINNLNKNQIKFLNIGGGMPFQFNLENQKFTFFELYQEIEKSVPQVKNFTLITEYGRSLVGKSGFLASRIEYIKEAGGRQIAVMQIGADMFVWAAYSKEQMMKFNPMFLNENGTKILKSAENSEMKLDLVGPLCFAGDNVCTNLEWIPELKENDVVILPNCGAYTFGTYSKFNSRSIPPIYLIKEENDVLKLVKPKEKLESNLSFWETSF